MEPPAGVRSVLSKTDGLESLLNEIQKLTARNGKSSRGARQATSGR
jgi:hypothetical protein